MTISIKSQEAIECMRQAGRAASAAREAAGAAVAPGVTTAEIDANLERPVVRALNALATFRNELPAFNGDFDYAVDGGAISFTWNDGSTSATLRFTPSLGMGVDNARSVAALTWTDAGGEHHSDDLIANPPVAHMD